MAWVFALLAFGLVVAFALVLSGRLPEIPQPTRAGYTAELPAHPSAGDVDQLRLPVALRGYRMDDVDAALAVLRDRIAELEAASVVRPVDSPFAPPEPSNG